MFDCRVAGAESFVARHDSIAERSSMCHTHKRLPPVRADERGDSRAQLASQALRGEREARRRAPLGHHRHAAASTSPPPVATTTTTLATATATTTTTTRTTTRATRATTRSRAERRDRSVCGVGALRVADRPRRGNGRERGADQQEQQEPQQQQQQQQHGREQRTSCVVVGRRRLLCGRQPGRVHRHLSRSHRELQEHIAQDEREPRGPHALARLLQLPEEQVCRAERCAGRARLSK